MIQDFFMGLKRWPMWCTLAWEDIAQRYRRNMIGPFWITLSTGMTIFAIAIIFTTIFSQKSREFVPFLTAGIILWNFICAIMTDSTCVFLKSRSIMMSIPLPVSFHIFQLILRNLIILAHVLVIYLFVGMYYSVSINIDTLMIFPALLLNVFGFIGICMLLGMLCARYRDLSQIILALLGICMYTIPIFWTPDMLGENAKYLIINPLYCFLEILRAPLLGHPSDPMTYYVCIGVSIACWFCAWVIFKKHRNDLIFWL